MKSEGLGSYVSQRRRLFSLTQTDLAKALGYTAQSISKFEAGESQISILVLPKLANLLNESLDDLLNQKANPAPLSVPNPQFEEKNLMSEQDKAQKDLEKENARKAKVQERELKRSASEKKELARLEKEKAKPKRKTYFWYLIVILCLIYIVDEVTTTLPNEMQPEISLDFFQNGMGCALLIGNECHRWQDNPSQEDSPARF